MEVQQLVMVQVVLQEDQYHLQRTRTVQHNPNQQQLHHQKQLAQELQVSEMHQQFNKELVESLE